MKLSYLNTLLICFFLLNGCRPKAEEVTVSSPDNKLRLIFKLVDGKPGYSLFQNEIPVILHSKLGFELDDLPSLDSNFILLDRKVSSFDETWDQVWGEVKTIRNKYTELKVFLREASDSQREMNIIFRVFDDGMSFRYEFPEQEFLDQFKITREETQFVLPANDTAWWIPAYMPERYEYLYRKTLVSEMDTAHTPLTLKTKAGTYLSFHEAALYDFPSYTLYPAGSNILELDLVPWKNGIKAYVEVPFITPWRTVVVADQPGDLVTNYMILNLNDTCKLDDVSWIKPTKYVGIWWGMHIDKYTWGSGPKHGATNSNTRKYIDFAAENGFGGVLIEGWNIGWDGDWIANGEIFSFTKAYPDFNLKELAEYANGKGVSLIGHHETSANINNYERQMEAAYQLYEDLGVRYLKTGYVGKKMFNGEWHHGQYGVRHYQKTVELAARHHIMLNIHEPIKDCGLRRTWPNLMCREGARGMEYDAWGADGGNPPSHVPTLVFTRLLAGPMDFTPGIFELTLPTKPDNQVNTTLAKQLAYYVVIYSPLQMAADLPENYGANPAFQFIRDVPCDWEYTFVLNASIGEYVTIVRKDRNSSDWYLGSITNESSRDFEIVLDFLDTNQKYNARIYADGEKADWKANPFPVDISDRIVSSADTLKIHLAPGGGQAIRLAPLPAKSD
jgi:alpha-glucosidase